MGIIWAFIAMVSWGAGDFLIQKSARRVGNDVALFCITLFGAIFLFPFILPELASLALIDYRFWLLLLTSGVLLLAALFNFEALRQGKLAVIEPICSFEVVITSVLSGFFLQEELTFIQAIFIMILIGGIVLTSVETLSTFRNLKLEKGVLLAFAAAIGMGLANFLFGLGSRHTSPLLINWFVNIFLALAVSIYLTYSKRWRHLWISWHSERRLILSVSLFDNMAWVAYAFSTLSIPIAIATGISESYIVLTVLAGIFLNKETIRLHQKIALIAVIIAAIVLSIVS